ncbi:MAG: hypothetical protein H7X77_07985 [Anaerolineae bacterium]|nr:hypothetical protein [Anaerolineae bacterium]
MALSFEYQPAWMIEAGTTQALQQLNAVKPYVPSSPTRITIEIDAIDKVDEFRGKHGVEIVAPQKVVSTGKNWMEAWDQSWHW